VTADHRGETAGKHQGVPDVQEMKSGGAEEWEYTWGAICKSPDVDVRQSFLLSL
jgi:hypothetical protein